VKVHTREFIVTPFCSGNIFVSEKANVFFLRCIIKKNNRKKRGVSWKRMSFLVVWLFFMIVSQISLFFSNFVRGDRAKWDEQLFSQDQLMRKPIGKFLEVFKVISNRICWSDRNYLRSIFKTKKKGSVAQYFKDYISVVRPIDEYFSGPIEENLGYQMVYFLFNYKWIIMIKKLGKWDSSHCCWSDPNYPRYNSLLIRIILTGVIRITFLGLSVFL
jgi:hypothetical protein